MVLGKRWLFSIGNVAEIRPIEMGRKSSGTNRVWYEEALITLWRHTGRVCGVNMKGQKSEALVVISDSGASTLHWM